MALPAAVAWIALAVLLPVPAAGKLAAAGGAALVAAAVLVARFGPRSVPRPVARCGGRRAPVSLGAGAAVVAVVLSVAAAHQVVRAPGPLSAAMGGRASVVLTGTVESDPRSLPVDAAHPRPRTVVRLLAREVDRPGGAAAVRTPVLLVGSGPRARDLLGVHFWERVRVRVRLSAAQPGDDVEAVALVAGQVEVVARAGAVAAATEHVRGRMREAVDGLPADPRGLVPALVIGDRSLTPPDLTADLTVTGMSHLSAVSGSNISIILGGVLVLLRVVGAPRRTRPVLGGLALLGFVALARPDPSVLRAAVMGAVGLIGLARSRRSAGLPALGAAVIVLLLWDPWLARAYGFALSVLATAGLLLFARPWADAIAGVLPARLRLLGEATAVPLVAGLVTAPVVVLLSGSVSVVSVVANLVAAPLVAPATIAGAAAAVGAAAWVPAGAVAAWVAALPAWGIAAVARGCADVPFGALPWRGDALGAGGLATILVGALLCAPWSAWAGRRLAARVAGAGPSRPPRSGAGEGPRRRRRVGCAVAVAALLAVVLGLLFVGRPQRLEDWRFAACDVGQGDALVLSTSPGHAVVVDAGPDADRVDACLTDLRVREVDALVLTHFHADHVAGVGGVSRGRPVRALFVTPVPEPAESARDVARWAAPLGLTSVPLVRGDELALGPVRARVLSPDHRPEEGSVPNNASVVLDVSTDGMRMLLLGDVERETGRAVVEQVAASADRRPIDVLKVAHHGSANLDPRLVTAVHAPLAVVSVGVGNNYGHPAPSTLRLLASAGSRVLRTDVDGQVRIGRDASGYLVGTSGPG
ncbi:ComEC/Rec2 family competence protein [Agilicoccus flavus]|uniref:ComEC/Rec2 family competence protein n=1 Tax=Agilicoccus flavus TaxID=2775968 RepID=UPI001CF6930B|nr:ComEC/Rec2 family competence protein [Agilicoccus flavus]